MTFRSRLRRQSAVWHLWERHHRMGGVVCTTFFRRTTPGEYVSGDLTADEVSLLRAHDGVVLEAMTRPLPVAPMPLVAVQAALEQAPWPPFMPLAETAMPLAQDMPINRAADLRAARQNRRKLRDQRASFAKYDE